MKTDEAIKFFEEVYEHAEEGELALFALPSRRSKFLPISGLQDGSFRSALEKQLQVWRDQNIYYSIGLMEPGIRSGRGTESDVSLIPGVWIDVDLSTGVHASKSLPSSTEEALEALDDALPIEPTITIHSGGGLHCYWLFDEVWEFISDGTTEGDHERERQRTQAMGLVQRFQAHFQRAWKMRGWHLDSTFDLARVLRVPGSLNLKIKNDQRPVDIVSNDGERYSISYLRESLDIHEEDLFSGWEGNMEGSSGGAPPSDWDYLKGESKLGGSGGRNNSLKMIVGACLERGESLERTLFEVLKYDATQHHPPLFKDITENKSSHDYTNALRFVTSIVESINRSRERQGLQAQRFIFKELEGAGLLLESKDAEVLDVVDLINDPTPIPDDFLEPGIVAPGEFLLIAGPPKSQKSLLCQDMCLHLAMGWDWMGMKVPAPRRVAYLNMEMSKRVLKKRLRLLPIQPQHKEQFRNNFKITNKFHLTLDDTGVSKAVDLLESFWAQDGESPDVIVIDPLVNVFSGNTENDNQEMIKFLKRVDAMRDRVNPEAAIIMLHHTSKITKRELEDDPFNCIRGAGALRGYYSSGMVISKISEDAPERKVFFEVRIDETPPPMVVRFEGDEGIFVRADAEVRIAGEVIGQRWDLEAGRQTSVVLRELDRLGREERRLLTSRAFCETYSNTLGLGSRSSISRKINELMSKGYIRLTDGWDLPDDVEKPNHRSDGFMVVEGMQLGQDISKDDGECVWDLTPVLPTHFKHSDSGAILEVESREVWVYQDGPEREEVQSKGKTSRVYVMDKEPKGFTQEPDDGQ